jgi:hypothetical protein
MKTQYEENGKQESKKFDDLHKVVYLFLINLLSIQKAIRQHVLAGNLRLTT